MKKVKRLAEEFRPDHYDLVLDIDREGRKFSGRVKISGSKVGRPSQRITLHQKGLKIASAHLKKYDKRRGEIEIKLNRINTHQKFDELRLHSQEILYPGQYEITIEFAGQITDSMHGIYPCNYRQKGKDKQLIATQFESHHAREAFPCVDEPEAKAVFDLTLKTPAGETVLANTPIKSQDQIAGRLETVFEPSPKMSTYLLAFAFGEMVSVSGKTKNNVAINCYGTPLAAGLLDFSLNAGIACVEFFEDYFGVPYPLAKLDMLALPDFSSGAMENWGLITYRESIMWVDPKHSSIETKQIAATVIAHEIAHQWFGNLVTMRWWDDLWLNESFANLMEYRAVDEIYPQWNIFEQFVNVEMNMAMRRDALAGVQSVKVDVKHPDEINSLFDPAIVYAKGGNILRMLMNYVGEDDFRNGLSGYFKKHAYANTSADDLWAALTQASGKDIAEFMNNWLNQPGYPVVFADYDQTSGKLGLQQERLLIGKGPSKTIWQVPLAAHPSLDKSLLKERTFELKAKGSDEPLFLNHNGQSYFVPLYTNEGHVSSLTRALAADKVGTIDRLLLLMHGSILETAGRVKTVNNLNLVSALSAEKDEAVWMAIGGILGSARRLINTDEKYEEHLNKFIRDLSEAAFKRLGWDKKPGDGAQEERLRNLILGMAAGAQNPEVLVKGKELFAKFNQPFDLAPAVRSSVYFVGVRHGSQNDFEKILNLYKSIDNADEKDEIAAALTSTRKEAQIKILLGLLTSGAVRDQDLIRWFAWLMRNSYATALTWAWLVDNWAWIADKFGTDKTFDAFPRFAAAAFSKTPELKQYQKFFEPKRDDPALTRVIDLGVEEIKGRVAWRKANETSVKNWLAER